MRDTKLNRPDRAPLPGEDEELHAFITAHDPAQIAEATAKVNRTWYALHLFLFAGERSHSASYRHTRQLHGNAKGTIARVGHDEWNTTARGHIRHGPM
jgi:hypothetical protein